MDPDACLAEMREAIAEGNRLHDEAGELMEEANDSGQENDECLVREQAAEQFALAAQRAQSLDEWLSRGGALPTAWAR